MLRVNAEGLHRVVYSKDISMCGFAPATIVLSAASNLGAKQGVLVKYATSGEISGDFRQVVGYAGLLLN
jgi:AmmeMemoRadiSam system protein B